MPQSSGPLSIPVLFHLGPVAITQTVVTTWAIMLILGILAWSTTRRFKTHGSGLQVAIEGVVEAMSDTVHATLPSASEAAFPLVATLWIFLVVANLAGIVPGVSAPTADLSATAALAVIVFGSVHWLGIRTLGVKKYLAHYIKPTPFLLPFEIISEISRTITLAVRLFGNMMSLELTALMVLFIAGFLIPIPILMLHIVEALVQAYIFGMLALIYVAGSMLSQDESPASR
ncbi:MAG TPA: F0F1 ATP synthase subunit A [Candidatus Binatia bacterium]|nr:F0F1 ATP synthase subunit A [Candidatus Binatia bacterium]